MSVDVSMVTSGTKTKALCVATRCMTADQFVATFHRFCDETSFFVATLNTRPVGLETPFAIQLADRTPVLRGLCVVLDAWTTPANPYKRPGIRLGIRRLTSDSQDVFARLQSRRAASSNDAPEITIEPTSESPPLPDLSIPPPAASTPLAGAALPNPGPVKTPPPMSRIDPKPLELGPPTTEPAHKPSSTTSPLSFLQKVPPPPGWTPGERLDVGKVEPVPVRGDTTLPRATAMRSPASSPEIRPPEHDVRDAKSVPGLIMLSAVKPRAAAEPVSAPSESEGADDEPPARISPIVDLATYAAIADPARANEPPLDDEPEPPPPERIEIIHERSETPDQPIPGRAADLAAAIAAPLVGAPPPQTEGRTPGSALVLPANPLMDLSDESIEGFIECTLFEETANFLKAPGIGDDDDLAPPPRPSSSYLGPLPVPGMPGSSSYIGPVPWPQMSPSYVGPLPVAGPDPHGGHRPTIPPYVITPPGMAPYDPSRPATIPPPMGAPMPYMMSQPMAGMPPDLAHDQPSYGRMNGAMTRLLGRAPDSRARRIPSWVFVAVPASIIGIILLVILFQTPAPPNPSTPSKPSIGSAVTPPPVVTPPAKPVVTDPGTPPVATTGSADEPEEVDEPEPPTTTTGVPVIGTGPCSLNVTTTPAGSLVQVDGQAIGPSPITISGACTRRRVDISHARYKPATQWVNVTADQPNVLDVVLTRPTHALTITTMPPGATIAIAGRRAGTSPTVVQIIGFAGMTITIEKPGWKTVTRRVYSKTPQDKLFVKLEK